MDELCQAMGNSGIKTGKDESTFTTQVFIQYHRAVQPHMAIPRLAIAPLGPQTTGTDCHSACEKQPAKAYHSSLDNKIW